MRRRSREPSPEETLLAAGVFDAEFYAAQLQVLGEAVTFELVEQAAAHWATHGHRATSPHPVVVRAALPDRVRRAVEAGGVAPLLAFLRDGGSRRRLSPVFEATGQASDGSPHPHPGGALGEALSRGAQAPLPGSGLTPDQVRQAAMALFETSSDATDLPPSSVTVIGLVPIDPVAARTGVRRHLGELDRSVEGRGVEGRGEVVLEGTTPALDAALDLATRFVGDHRVRIRVRPGGSSTAQFLTRALDRAGGEITVVAQDLALPRDGALASLLTHLEDPSVIVAQPLVLDESDRIVCAGWVVAQGESAPVRALAGLAREDGLRAGHAELSAPSRLAMAARTEDLRSGRVGEPDGGKVLLEPTSVFSQTSEADDTPWPTDVRTSTPDPWQRAGLERRSDRSVVVAPDHGPRWGIRSAAPGGAGGERWGDTHFARSLACALEGEGAQAVVHCADAAPTPVADDVTLTLRGLKRMPPMAGTTNVLWVISHPDEVTDEELDEYDLVFAASGRWAAERSRPIRPVEVLHQATDAAITAVRDIPVGAGDRPVFVGGTFPDRDRPIVHAALGAAIPLDIHGPGWEGALSPEQAREHLVGDFVANQDLGMTYRTSGLVLADHAPEMARHGFLANRLFDAVAAGARVISDAVEGTELFQGAVATFSTPGQLTYLCSEAGRADFPGPDEMTRIADRVAIEHSFAARARALLLAVRARASA